MADDHAIAAKQVESGDGISAGIRMRFGVWGVRVGREPGRRISVRSRSQVGRRFPLSSVEPIASVGIQSSNDSSVRFARSSVAMEEVGVHASVTKQRVSDDASQRCSVAEFVEKKSALASWTKRQFSRFRSARKASSSDVPHVARDVHDLVISQDQDQIASRLSRFVAKSLEVLKTSPVFPSFAENVAATYH